MPRRTIQFAQGGYYHVYNLTHFETPERYQAFVVEYLDRRAALPRDLL